MQGIAQTDAALVEAMAAGDEDALVEIPIDDPETEAVKQMKYAALRRAAGNNGYLAADTEGAFITASFYGVTDREALEAYADGIAFAALSERFADTDTSDIAAAVFAELGHHTITELPEGYVFRYDSAEWKSDRIKLLWPSTSTIMFGGSTWRGGDASDMETWTFLTLGYTRY